ncbi:NOX2 [Acanthosepion pharaonis]|uniref:NOX2 n=1 Tax=Acanthosepion pharaonis TaxID=158019 RepID=A0A812AT22_ACAPH|nr:NOX2 [Sepia pharaonis]
MLPICRNLLSFFRGTFRCRFIRRSLDKNIMFHKYFAYMICLQTAIHTGAHCFNLEWFVQAHDSSDSELRDFLYALSQLPITENGTYINPVRNANANPVIELFKLLAGSSGAVITLCLILMVTSATDLIRRSYFEVFWFTHHLFVIFFIGLIVHGLQGVVRHQTNVNEHDPDLCYEKFEKWGKDPDCLVYPSFGGTPAKAWKWVALPLFLYVIECLIRLYRRYQKVFITKYDFGPYLLIPLSPFLYPPALSSYLYPPFPIFLTLSHLPCLLISISHSLSPYLYPPFPVSLSISPLPCLLIYIPPSLSRYLYPPFHVSLSISPLPCLLIYIPPSLSPYLYPSFPVSLSLSLLPCLLICIPPSLSPYLYPSFSVSLSVSLLPCLLIYIPPSLSHYLYPSRPVANIVNWVKFTFLPSLFTTLSPSLLISPHHSLFISSLLPLSLYLIPIRLSLFLFFSPHRYISILPSLAFVVKHPCNTIQLQLKRAGGFKIEPGQYVFLQCPRISRLEWHPFTLTSAPGDDYISVHIRRVGEWTNALAKACFVDDNITPTPRQLPIMAVDGPFGTATEDVFTYKVDVFIGTGIGVTPFASVLKYIK